ncbi:4-oxalocrotonate tautomerase family protein [Aquabacterium sp.]|uniref:tautomerase family protein n=1 Tax=Aquabacterium sp. TaxID=1872578 RepID=UPI003782FFB6
MPYITVTLPPDILPDEARRAQAIRQLHDALAEAKPPQDPRPLLSSVILDEVPDGHWGANGQLWRLADFARAAGFRHLQHLRG